MRRRWLGTLVLMVLALWPAPLLAGPTREEALKALADKGSADSRRLGAQALGETGLMSDLPQLAAALRDNDEVVRENAESSMWQVWSRSGDPTIDRLFATGLEQMNARQGEPAVETFSEIIRRKPEFAEGWNKRATVYFIAGDFRHSLADCDQVMKRNPNHFGALAGYGQIYFQMEQYEKAISYWKRALKANPNMVSVEDNIEIAEKLVAERRRNTI